MGDVNEPANSIPEEAKDPDYVQARLRIRRFTRADVPAVRMLLWEVWRDAYTHILGAEGVEKHCAVLHTKARLNGLSVDLDNQCSLVVDLDGQVIAFASAVMHWNGAVDIYELYVAANHQGHGLGTRLIEALFYRFPGAHRWRIEVLAANTSAGRLYQRLGFRQTGSRSDWYQPEIEVLQLAKPGNPAARYSYAALIAIQLRSLLQSFDPRR